MSALAAAALVVGRSGFAAGPFEFALAPGTLTAVIGPNGAGKTTLLKTLAGLLPPLSGTISPSPDAGSAAYLPPPGTISAEFSARHLVALGRAAHRGWSPVLAPDDYDAALAAMAEAGIAHVADKPFAQLSSGQQQLVLVARLLVQNAQLCLLDEPTALLDPAQLARVDRAMRLLAEAGRTVVASTHRLEFAAKCDLVIAVGAEAEAGPPAQMMRPEKIAALYGAELSLCLECGHASVSA